MKFKVIVMIICQTSSSIGLGFSIIFLRLFKLPNGPEILGKLFGQPTFPYMGVIILLILFFISTAFITCANVDMMLEATENKS